MATQRTKKENLLYLDQITLQDIPKLKLTPRLFVENEERDIQRKDTQTWALVQRQDVSPTSQLRVEIQMKPGHLPWATKERASKEIDLRELYDDYWTSKAHELALQEVVAVGKHRFSLELQFSAEATAESLRSSLHKLEELLKDYSPLMKESTEKTLEKLFKFGAAFAELNDIAKAAFSVAEVTLELLQEQNKYDQMPADLLDRLQRILFFADKVADEIVYEETEVLEKTIPRMFEVMQRVAKFSCDYVRRGRFERTLGGLVHPEKIEEMDKELTKVIEDFDRAVNVEALRLAKETKLVQQDIWLKERLKPVEASYGLGLCCMEGTRGYILNRVIAWVTNGLGQKDVLQSTPYWIYGLPGIGKTSLAHSICEKLDQRKQFAGAFFCRRDDTNLSEPRHILPTLIYQLAKTSPPFRSIVTKYLHKNQHMTPQSMQVTLFLEFIRSIPCHSNQDTLVVVIDALDECGNTQSRAEILKVLIDAAALASWLKIIITSRPEVDITRSLDTAEKYHLDTDPEATDDLRTFAQRELNLVAERWHFPTPWPEEFLFNRVISQANGHFIFIKTLVLALEKCEDPEESLREALQGSASAGLAPLYRLYSSILKAHSKIAGFWRMITVITTAQYRPLRKEPIAELAGVKPNFVEKWADDLSSLLYRGEGANGAIRVRHLSISEYFASNRCDYQADLRAAHMQQGIACLQTMVKQLHFNICKLEDSRLANTDIKDLPSRIEQNISDPLQYSSLYWSTHLRSTPDEIHHDRRILGSLKEFFEGLYPLFWIEVLSVMGMVSIGAPSLRGVISLVKDTNSTLLERIKDICRFIITFHSPISVSAPHTYISTRPFLPTQSPLWAIFSTRFTKGIKMQRGKLVSWPAPPFKWIGHTRAINCICYSPPGTHIVTGSDDKTIRIWDAETGVVVGEALKGHTESVQSVAYSPDGRYIISGSDDKTIRIWDAETGAAVGKPFEAHTGPVKSVAYSPDGQNIISGSDDNTIRIWDARTGAAVGEPLVGHTDWVGCIAYSPDGQHIISGSGDETVRIWDAESGSAVGKPLEGHTSWVRSIAYSPDGQHIISGSGDNTIRIWDAETGAAVGKPLVGHTDWVRSIAYSPDGRHITSGSDDKTIRIWDAETGVVVGKPLKGHTSWVRSIAYSPDGQHIISGSADTTIRIWDAETGAAVGKPLVGHTRRVQSVAYSPDGQHIISGSDDHTIRIWNAETGAAVGKPLEAHTGPVGSVAYSPDGQNIISGSGDSTIRIWSAETGAAVGKPLVGHTDCVWPTAYSPDGRHITSGSDDKTIRIWDAETGAAVGKPLEGHTSWVRSIAYSPDGQHIISGSVDSTIRIWDAETGAAVGKPLVGHTDWVRSIAYSPDGRHIISGSDDKTIRIWDAETGGAVGKPLVGHTGWVRSIAYSPDGRYIISGSDDKTIRIWDAETGAAVGKPLEGHTKPVVSVAYSPTGQRIVSGSDDHTIRVWDAFRHISTQISFSSNPMQPHLFLLPDADGWVHDLEGRLLYWVPPDCRIGLHSHALLTIPPTSHIRSVSLDFEGFAYGTSWTHIFNSTQP